MIARVFQGLRKRFPILVIAGAFVWASVTIAVRRVQEAPADVVVIRLAHWQLESGVRDGINEMARAYQKLHPNVRISQEAIPEGTYGQWVSTQLMGATAPDIIEYGLGLPYNIWLAYLNRYFVPLTRHVNAPNPYNGGTPFEDVPLRETYHDGMRNAYIEELQEYMTIPLAMFGVRIFYNQDLLQKLTGREQGPTELRDFLAVCESIKTNISPRGRAYIPIAGSKYHVGMWDGMMCDPLTFGMLGRADFNYDGYVGNDEMFTACRAGYLTFHNPYLAAKFAMLHALTQEFQPGFTGLNRDEAVFLFAQQRAVFMTTGTWDAGSLRDQARGHFRLGVMDFPEVRPDDPEFGRVALGPRYERPTSSFSMGVTRFSHHPEVAIDFLLFMASRANNERLNHIIGWMPVIRDTDMDELLKAFQPHLEGTYGCFNPNLGGETWIKWLQEYSLFQVSQISYEGLVKEFVPFYKERGLLDYLEQQKDWRRGIANNEQMLAAIRARALLTSGVAAQSGWVKYRALTARRMVTPELGHADQLRLVKFGPAPGEPAPYEYSSNALARLRSRDAPAPAAVPARPRVAP